MSISVLLDLDMCSSSSYSDIRFTVNNVLLWFLPRPGCCVVFLYCYYRTNDTRSHWFIYDIPQIYMNWRKFWKDLNFWVTFPVLWASVLYLQFIYMIYIMGNLTKCGIQYNWIVTLVPEVFFRCEETREDRERKRHREKAPGSVWCESDHYHATIGSINITRSINKQPITTHLWVNKSQSECPKGSSNQEAGSDPSSTLLGQ